MLPGLHADAARADGDALARWSCEAAPLVARALLLGGEVPAPGQPLPDGASLRAARARFGRFPGSFVASSSRFERAVSSAVQDDGVLCRIAGAVFGVGLLALDRTARRDALARVPDALALAARRTFEGERAEAALGPAARTVAAAAWDVAPRPGASPRAVACTGLARVFGDAWLDELRVLAGVPLESWRIPVTRLAGRGELESWWIGRPW